MRVGRYIIMVGGPQLEELRVVHFQKYGTKLE